MSRAPWPCLAAGQAARRLGVSTRFLDGLRGHHDGANTFCLRSISVQLDSGKWVLLYNREDVETLAKRLGVQP